MRNLHYAIKDEYEERKPLLKQGRFEEVIEPSQAQVIEPVKPKRGRRPGSKNKPKVTTTTTTTTVVNKRRVGRPSKAEKGKALASEWI